MSVYFNKRRKWWEYYFRHNKRPYTKAGFKTKKEALAEEAERKKEVKQPQRPRTEQIDMDFLTLCNRRLDYLAAYRSDRHYQDTVYLAKRWVKQWSDKTVHEISTESVQNYLIEVCKAISAQTANKELRGLRAIFNFGVKKPNRWFNHNPTDDLDFFPVEQKKKYVPPIKDVIAVLLAASGEFQDYLWTIALTLGRMSEVNRLEKSDLDFENGVVTLYTRKSKNGNLTPREIPMTAKLKEVLLN
ncbi:MAG TPA: integrase, partial [Desulfobacteraceae bacterium]|nr:integrase [Desulfobacteraceae bacterium]